jgi:hypothetical protein
VIVVPATRRLTAYHMLVVTDVAAEASVVALPFTSFLSSTVLLLRSAR